MNHRHPSRRIALALLASFLAGSVGCSHFQDPKVPGPIRTLVAPELEREYLCYRPSSYDRGANWPLIVVCHGGFPDSPRERIRTWAPLAESHGFLVVAPTLEGVHGLWSPKPDEQLARQRRDERHILSVIDHVRAGHSISTDRIFIHGWSEGASAALHTGLRHSELFRGVVLTSPAFEDVYVADVGDRVDPHQQIMVRHNVGEFLVGNAARQCVAWLRSHRAALSDDSIGIIDKDDESPSVEFIEEVIRRHPWIHIRTVAGDDPQPRSLRFRLDCSFAPRRYRWSFGDGQTSAEAEPTHVYGSPGAYEVGVTVDPPQGEQHTRTTVVHVP